MYSKNSISVFLITSWLLPDIIYNRIMPDKSEVKKWVRGQAGQLIIPGQTK